jgi:dTDP-4-dehydrorhamnose reductase
MLKKKILLIGANGWLAQSFHKEFFTHSVLSSQCALFGTYHDAVPEWISEENRIHYDLADEQSAEDVISKLRPDIILHFAAVSSPVKCHTDEQLAYKVNCPENLLKVVKEIVPCVLYIFTSTDMVYDGLNPPYFPAPDPSPVNVYGKTKLAFEQLLLQSLKHVVVLRLSNMLGPAYEYEPCGEKFLEWLCKSFYAKQFIGLKADERRSFVHVKDVCKLVLTIIDRFCGNDAWISNVSSRIFNVGGPVGLSRLDVAKILCESLHHKLVVLNKDDDSSSCSDESGKVWKVYEMSSSSVSGSSSSLKSPLDITMNSSHTEDAVGVKFQSVSEYIFNCTK